MSTQDWRDLAGDLPVHQDELMSAHGGQPTMQVQDITHGAGRPGVDNGTDEAAKYASGGMC